MSVSRSSIWFSLGTFFSRISGLIRDSVVAGVFGASIYHDAFVVAFRLPNLLRDMLAEGALSGAFTKVYASASQTDPKQAQNILGDALRLVWWSGLIICLIGISLSPWLVELVTLVGSRTGDHETLQQLAKSLTQLLFPYLLMPMLGAILMGALHQHGRFFVSAISPIGLNLGFVFGALVFAQCLEAGHAAWISQWIGHAGIAGLAMGALLGGLLQLAAQYWGVRQEVREAMQSRRKLWPLSPELRNMLAIMLPATVAASAGPINVMINTNFATSLGAGAVTWLNYAFRLLQLPIGIFGVAVASAALPALARSVARAGKKVDAQVSAELQGALELVLWFMAVSVTFIAVNSGSLISLIFQHWNFSAEDSRQTAAALQAYSFGIVGYGLVKVLTSFYFAVERTAYAMRVSLLSIGVTFVGNYVLVQSVGHIGLALTSSLSLTLNALVLIFGLRASRVSWNFGRLLKSLVLMASSGAVAWLLQSLCGNAIGSLDWSPLTNVKVRSASILTMNGIIVVACFSGAALYYLQVGPKSAWNQLRARRARGK